MKKYLGISLMVILAVLLGGNAVMAKDQPNGNPFGAIWQALAYLQEQINNIQLIPGPQGEQGIQGEQGEPGQDAQHGAGNIALIFYEYLLKTDGTVWKADVDGNFQQLGNEPPIPVTDIVSWQRYYLLDKDGNYWMVAYGNWQNFGPLP